MFFLTLPAFDRKVTPTEFMGVIPEVFLSFPKVERSDHSTHSFGLWGKKGRSWSLNHPLDESLSDYYPLGKLYENKGFIFILGVDHSATPPLHLAETMVYDFPKQKYGFPMMKGGKKVWEEYDDLQYNSDDFNLIGNEFEKKFPIK